MDNYSFEYAPADMPLPSAIDVLEDYAYLEYDYNLFVSDGNLKSVGPIVDGQIWYSGTLYDAHWELTVNGGDWTGRMDDCPIFEGDRIVFSLCLEPTV